MSDSESMLGSSDIWETSNDDEDGEEEEEAEGSINEVGLSDAYSIMYVTPDRAL